MTLYEAIRKFAEYSRFAVQENTNNSYGFILRGFCLYLRNPKLEAVTLEHVIEWFQMMDDLGWDMNSIIPKAIVLRQFFGYLQKSGIDSIHPDLIPVPRRKTKLPRVASVENYEKLLSVIPEKDPVGVRNKAMIMMYRDTGCRNSELLSIDLKDIDTEKRRGVIRTEKARNREFREIFWTEETNTQLKNWLRIRKKFTDNDILFITLSNNWTGKRMSKRMVVTLLENYSEKADIPTLNAHSLMHLFGKEFSMGGANNSAISSLMGHANMQSSMVYTTLYGDDLKQVWEKYR